MCILTKADYNIIKGFPINAQCPPSDRHVYYGREGFMLTSNSCVIVRGSPEDEYLQGPDRKELDPFFKLVTGKDEEGEKIDGYVEVNLFDKNPTVEAHRCEKINSMIYTDAMLDLDPIETLMLMEQYDPGDEAPEFILDEGWSLGKYLEPQCELNVRMVKLLSLITKTHQRSKSIVMTHFENNDKERFTLVRHGEYRIIHTHTIPYALVSGGDD